MSTPDRAPSPSPNGKLARFRLGKKNNISTQSLGSSNSTEVDENGANLSKRTSMEVFVDKIGANSRRSSEDKRLEPSRLSRLLKRRKSNHEEAERRPSVLSTDLTHGDDQQRSVSREGSTLSFNPSESGRSSLITEDSDDESRPTRPTLSPHQSHAGYLTLSSPLIKTSSAPDIVTSSVPAPAARSVPSEPDLTPTLQNDTNGDPPAVTVTDTDTEANDEDPPSPPYRDSPSQPKSSYPSRRKDIGSPRKPPRPSSSGATVDTTEHQVGQGNLHRSSGGSPLPTETDQEQAGTSVQEDAADKAVTKQNQSPALPKSPLLVDTSRRPSTPPNAATTPSTFVTPPTPTGVTHESPPKKGSGLKLSFNSDNDPKISTFTRSRTRPKSGTSGNSKLSNAILNPLTPPLEETKTPGGTLTSPSGSFFTSWVSVAQNAANSLTQSLNQSVNQGQKTKQAQAVPSEDRAAPAEEEELPLDGSTAGPPQERAIETIGKGELNLGHLGIEEDQAPAPMVSTNEAPDQASQRIPTSGTTAQKAEEDAAARAISVAYDKPVVGTVGQGDADRPRSIASVTSGAPDQSPTRSSTIQPDAGDIKRSGSIRSRLSDRKQRRHRGSSATTGGTLAPSLTTSSSTVQGPALSGHRATGFAVASSKRNKDFHQLFRSVPEDDYLIEDYSAALQRDILLHGRFYISEGHVCFSSNILGWVTNLVIAFDEIVAIEKKNTAIVFPNAIVIQTLHARNTFASLVARDSTFDLLLGIWKTSHPNLHITENSVTLGDKESVIIAKAEKDDSTGSDDGSDAESDDVYDEDADHTDEAASFIEPGLGGSIAGSDAGETVSLSRRPSGAPLSAAPVANGSIPNGLENADPIVTGAAVAADYPGPPTHDKTDCADQASHYDKPLIDTTIPAPLGKIYTMMFGPASGAFMKKWLVDDQKSRELSFEDDKVGLDNDHKQFVYSYIKPLSAPVGPKQTKCIVTSNLQAFDLEGAVSVDQSTATPDVPSGSVFSTKTRYCLMWGPGNSTRIVASCTIEWTGKSWLKGPIEKGANDGQIAYIKDLVNALRAAVTTKPPVKGQARGKGKGKRRKETFDTTGTEAERASAEATNAASASSWGLLEPLHGLLGPITGIVSPLISSQMIIGLLLLLLLQSWFFGGRRTAKGLGFPLGGPERLAAYEAIWQREEAELWDWLEDRIGMDERLSRSLQNLGGDDEGANARLRQQQLVMKSNAMGRKLQDETTGRRQIDDAIQATEERLAALKEAVGKQKGRTKS